VNPPAFAFHLAPRPVSRPWGGRRIARRFGWADDQPRGEWWLVSCREDAPTARRGDGIELSAWLDHHGSARGCGTGSAFPLLVKFLDSQDVLSLQVHPDDEVAHRHGLPSGKTEAWHVLAAEPAAHVFHGTAPGVTCAELLQCVRDGASDQEIEAMLRRVEVSAGDTLLVPAGTVGIDGSAPGLAEYLGSQAAQTGFHALDSVDIFNLMILPPDRGPGAADRTQLWGPASNYCAQHRAFLLVDPPDDWTSNGRPVATATEVNTLRAPIVNDYAAAFYPRVRYSDRGILKYTGASGAIAGLMARTDSTRGVWKAPAGLEADLRAIVELEVKLTDGENGVLNKLGVNCLRQFPSGCVSWGARTLDGADDFGSEWKYVPIRRFALFLEESLFRGTKWVVFEPNDEPLWAKIRMNLNAFMMGLFRQGAFQGSTPDLAFFVKCDSETTTQNDRNLGIVNIEVGFAPLKPAEFVIIKIQQIAGDLG